eukprot:TRINITY_DN900_c0_g1_i1.p1 TRINITY_DN900_c0_g1~~TRINITY_DN900_c0_g1_i1.p1  ORF type:complete len:156 (-),score=35.57 TRINITY_DN900_c0_g1_i1:504-971(-)
MSDPKATVGKFVSRFTASISRTLKSFRVGNPDRPPYIHQIEDVAYRFPAPASSGKMAKPPKDWEDLKYNIKLYDRDNTPSGKLQVKYLIKFDPQTHQVTEQAELPITPLPFDATHLPTYEWIDEYPALLEGWKSKNLPPLPGRPCKWKIVEKSDT